MAKMTLDKLAVSIKENFDDMGKSINTRFDGVTEDIAELKQGQEDIKLRLDNHAYKLDVDDLKTRVVKIEKKIGIDSPNL